MFNSLSTLFVISLCLCMQNAYSQERLKHDSPQVLHHSHIADIMNERRLLPSNGCVYPISHTWYLSPYLNMQHEKVKEHLSYILTNQISGIRTKEEIKEERLYVRYAIGYGEKKKQLIKNQCGKA